MIENWERELTVSFSKSLEETISSNADSRHGGLQELSLQMQMNNNEQCFWITLTR